MPLGMFILIEMTNKLTYVWVTHVMPIVTKMINKINL